MTVFGICMVRDAEDIIGPIIEHTLTQVDYIVVANNLSIDNTDKIIKSFPRTHVIQDDDPAYEQSKKMTRLARVAKELGADWVVPFDADEFWYSPFGTIKDILSHDQEHYVYEAAMYDHVPTAIDPDYDNPLERIVYRRGYKGALPKVACRVRDDLTIKMGNHSVSYDYLVPQIMKDQLVIRHFPYRTPKQFVDKAIVGDTALSLANLDPSEGAHWRQYAELVRVQGREALEQVFKLYFWAENADDLVYDPVYNL